ncbi:MAG: 3-deoxy-manno-octulosonate cytidylyltransferase [Lysobacter sp.]|nr:3-deoxy-manno-octulosonate cytidylyltransferase [Lysobacter sp.]
MNFVVAIPARHDASRLPGKPLRLLGGEPLILHVARRALAAGAREVWVAADDARIIDALAGSGVRTTLTASTHASGTDRLAECAAIAGWSDDTVVVNLQGDEPFAPAAGIRAVAARLLAANSEMATLATPIEEAATVFDPNTVKLVRDASGHALYFSRAPIPWARDAFSSESKRMPATGEWLRHIGIYAYRAGFLRRFTTMPRGQLEQMESLEQLRALEAGVRIAVELTPEPFPPGIDTPEDLARAQAHLAQAHLVAQR